MIIKIDQKYNSLEVLLKALKQDNRYQYDIKRDQWSKDLFVTNQKCIVAKHTFMYGARINFVENNCLDVSFVIPSNRGSMTGIFGSIYLFFNEQRKSNLVLNIVEYIKNLE